MKKEFILKKCKKCGAMVEILEDCACDNCGIKCCGEEMETLNPNSVDAAIEKHLPEYETIGNYIVARVNHVMEDDHYIDFIALDSNTISAKKFLKVGEKAQAVFPYVKGSRLYAYCNKHGVWSTEVL